MKQLLMVALTIGLASACGGDNNDSNNTTANNTTANNTTANNTTANNTTANNTTANNTTANNTTANNTTANNTTGGFAGSCAHDDGQCLHYINEFDTPMSTQQDCDRVGGTYSADECPLDDVVAICDQTPFKIFHFDSTVDLTLAELTCDQIGGTYTLL